MKKIVIIDETKCIACQKCVKICPKKILFIDPASGKCNVTDENLCGKSGCCEKICPVGAIRIIK